MNLGLEGRLAIVGASTSGLGLAVAKELAAEGAAVFVGSRDADRVDRAVEVVAAVARDASRVAGLAVDLSADDGPDRFVAGARARFGATPDILVANNGGPPPGGPLDVDEDAWLAGYRSTFRASRRLAELVVPDMRGRGWGRVVFVTSTSVKEPIEGLAISTAMRSGLVGWAKMLADEVARDGVTVNCVAPGTTRTPRVDEIVAARARRNGETPESVLGRMEAAIPVGRLGRPEEFAAVVAFLASQRASFLTGAVIPVDGGARRALG